MCVCVCAPSLPTFQVKTKWWQTTLRIVMVLVIPPNTLARPRPTPSPLPPHHTPPPSPPAPSSAPPIHLKRAKVALRRERPRVVLHHIHTKLRELHRQAILDDLWKEQFFQGGTIEAVGRRRVGTPFHVAVL